MLVYLVMPCFFWVLWPDPRNPQVPRKNFHVVAYSYPNISHDGVQPIRSFLDVHRIRKWSIIDWNIPWFFPVKMLGMRISLGYHLGYRSEYSQWSSQDIPMIIFPMVGSPDLYQLRTGPSGGTAPCRDSRSLWPSSPPTWTRPDGAVGALGVGGKIGNDGNPPKWWKDMEGEIRLK
jgi:hypothetical protein